MAASVFPYKVLSPGYHVVQKCARMPTPRLQKGKDMLIQNTLCITLAEYLADPKEIHEVNDKKGLKEQCRGSGWRSVQTI